MNDWARLQPVCILQKRRYIDMLRSISCLTGRITQKEKRTRMEGKTRQRGTDERHRADDILPESEARLDVSGSTGLAEVSPNRLELFFSQSLDGFFFIILYEPVQLDGSVDK